MTARPAPGAGVKDMTAVPAGSFVMGSDDSYPEERPAHRRDVPTFVLDQHPVTTAEFRRFVKATGHVTTAETPPTVQEFPDANPDDLVPGSLVFVPTAGPVPLHDWRRWWCWTPGADWRHPEGPDSTLDGRQRHPVVHVSWEDAKAYAAWAGKRLASEVEWEYAARAGRAATVYAWGDELTPKGRRMANTWHGRFPFENLDGPRERRTSAIGLYPANPWGLHDMIGNVWEWTATPWTADHSDRTVLGPSSVPSSSCCAPSHAVPREDERRVIKGGSHLCAPSYCRRYRPPARQGQTVRSSTSHLGFRCAASA